MHLAGLELTKLTYTRLEDNLIRHRGDRLKLLGDSMGYISGMSAMALRDKVSRARQKKSRYYTC